MYKVMIVEDDPMVAMINEQYLSRNPSFEVVKKCSSGVEALKYLEINSVDLIIMDVYMPQKNGIETLKEIRAQDIPVSVIMVTAANDPETLAEAIRHGAIDYLVKPFSYERFQFALERFDAGQTALKEGDALNQNRIDKIVGGLKTGADTAPKGIQENTRTTILDCLASAGDWMTGDEIAEKTGLSSVTVRRYMNHLVRDGQVTGEMNYETGGRPSMIYKI